MPPMDPRARYPANSNRISIPSLSGGVGRQAPTKRAVNEAENLDNVLCTLERSAEKRPGTEFIRRYTDRNFDTLETTPLTSSLDLPDTSEGADYRFIWFQVSDDQRYLVVVNYLATASTEVMRCYRFKNFGFFECPILDVGQSFFEYLTYGNNDPNNKADDILSAITIGPQLIILNKLVKAGYTSKEVGGVWQKVDKAGNTTGVEDIQGRKLTYFTSAPGDAEGEATLYISEKFYVVNDEVYAFIDSTDGNNDMTDYGYVPPSGGDPSSHPELDPFVDASGILQEDLVLVFSCTQDGIASNEQTPGEPTYGNAGGSNVAHFVLRKENDGGPLAYYLAVEDWRYPDPSKPYLGQSLDDFSEFKFPPKDSDPLDSAEGRDQDGSKIYNRPNVDMEGKVSATLASLYDFLAFGEGGRTTAGTGKIYSVDNSYAGEPPGYYIITKTDDKPYLRRVRTPFEYSVLDADRFPKIFKINNTDNDVETFELINFDLEERRAGNLQTNPGPLPFKDGNQANIQSMAFFRNRLFLSVGDTVFSSRAGDFSDFWIESPGSLNDKDPIETTLSTNKYAEVTSMTPFEQYLFINTGSDIQFTMEGSENRITPFNAEVSPTAFYSTSPLVDPVLLGSQIYFFAPRRAYVYFNDKTVSINQAIEVSLNAPNYLPDNFGQIAVCPGYDSMAMLDKDNPKFIYMYTNRYSGSQVTQNAFFRYIMDTDYYATASFDNQMYYVNRYVIADGATTTYEYYLEVQDFYNPDISIPKLDHRLDISEVDLFVDPEAGTIDYDPSTGNTTLVISKYNNQNPDTLYIGVSIEDPLSGTIIDLISGLDDGSVVSVGAGSNGQTTIVLVGDYTTPTRYRKFSVGTSFKMEIQLSPQYVRDQEQNVVEGVLSLRTLHLSHFNTGDYRVEKSTRGRRVTSLSYSPAELDELGVADADLNSPLPVYEKKGESFTKIMGYAAETEIYIVSDTANPVNITQIELKGKFSSKTSGFIR